MESEWSKLNVAQQAITRQAIERCRSTGRMARIKVGERDECYAYPHANGGIAWGYDGGKDGFNIARGVEE